MWGCVTGIEMWVEYVVHVLRAGRLNKRGRFEGFVIGGGNCVLEEVSGALFARELGRVQGSG